MAAEAVKVLGLSGVLEALRSLPPEIVSKNGGVIRGALRKGGVVILEQARVNVQRIVDEANKDGRFVSTGVAKAALRIKRTRPLGGRNGEAFIVAVARTKYAGKMIARKGRKAAELAANDVLFMLEAGTSKRRPMPWMRPAFDAKRDQALDTFVTEARKGVDRAIKKAAKLAAAKANVP